MTRLEVLKLLPAKSVNIEHIPGGIPALVSPDVANALSHAPEEASIFVRIKYCLDENLSNSNRLKRLLVMKRLPDIVNHASWDNISDEMIEKMLCVALSEAMSDIICRTCRGHGLIEIDKVHVPCEPCGGSGRKSFSSREVARRLNLDCRNYKRRYDNQYRQLLNTFYDLEHEANHALRWIG